VDYLRVNWLRGRWIANFLRGRWIAKLVGELNSQESSLGSNPYIHLLKIDK
jgi:hypothetical protein